ncbi:zinc finger, CCHC-type containing protein [Tanacetum coccineum]
MALAAAGKEVECLKNLLLEILLWFKPIAPISIRCDSATKLAKSYSQMYNEKSRHLGVRHSMIRELIMNRVISIEFVRSQKNLVDHLMKGLTRDLVIKFVEGDGIKVQLTEGDLRKFSDIGAWYAIEDCAQYDKKCSNPTSTISDETIANLNAQIVGDDMVRVQVPREVPSFDGLEPQPLLNSTSLDVSPGGVIGPEPPIKPHRPDSSRMKVVDYLTTQTPPLPHVANSHPKVKKRAIDVYPIPRYDVIYVVLFAFSWSIEIVLNKYEISNSNQISRTVFLMPPRPDINPLRTTNIKTSWLQMDLQKKIKVTRISAIRLLIAMASIHNLIIHQMDVKTTFLNGEFGMRRVHNMNQPYGFIMPDNENKHPKKSTYITGLAIESKFVALADAGKEAEWLRNLILDISLWSKPIALISIRCDSAATLAKAYSQMTPNSLLSKLLAEVQCEMLNVQKWNKAACFTFHPKYVLGTAEKQRKERSLLIPNRLLIIFTPDRLLQPTNQRSITMELAAMKPSKRWQKKMHFMLSSMSVVYARGWRGLILNGMSDSLFDIYQNIESSKELWNSLEAKYITKDASSKKFLVNNFINYKMTDSRPVLEQYNELLGILRRFQAHLKHLKEELTLVELGSHLRIEESLKVQDSDKPKGNNVAGPSVVNMVEHNNSSRYNDNKGKRKHHDNTRADPNKKEKPTVGNVAKLVTLKGIAKVLMLATKLMDDDVAW